MILKNIKQTLKMVHKIETTPLKHILKQIDSKYGISQQEIEDIPSDDSREERAWIRLQKVLSIWWSTFELKIRRINMLKIQTPVLNRWAMKKRLTEDTIMNNFVSS